MLPQLNRSSPFTPASTAESSCVCLWILVISGRIDLFDNIATRAPNFISFTASQFSAIPFYWKTQIFIEKLRFFIKKPIFYPKTRIFIVLPKLLLNNSNFYPKTLIFIKSSNFYSKLVIFGFFSTENFGAHITVFGKKNLGARNRNQTRCMGEPKKKCELTLESWLSVFFQ